MRIMGLDFGSRTVGVAISDSLLLTAQGVEIIRRKEENKLRQTLARIEEQSEKECEVEELLTGISGQTLEIIQLSGGPDHAYHGFGFRLTYRGRGDQ